MSDKVINEAKEKTVRSLLKASLFTDEFLEISDYSPVFSEMKEQAVAALPGEWLETHLPLASDWISYCNAQQGLWVRIMHEQSELITLLEENHIPCVIIKGIAAAMYYPHPFLRTMGDVDVLVKRSDLNRAERILEENGYFLEKEKNLSDDQYLYYKNTIHFELHKRLPIIDESNERFLTLFEEGIDKREWHESEGFRFPMLPSHLNGLVLIFHINQHLREGIGLRQIVDWMMYAYSVSANTWKQLIPSLKETGMEKLALTVTAMCQKYLGLEKTVIQCDEIDMDICDKLMSFIFEKGNFGRKAGVEGKTAAFALSSTGARSFFKRLQISGLDQWDMAKRYPILRPFAWIYQSFRIMRIYAKNGIHPKMLLKQRRKGKEQRELLEALGLHVDRAIHVFRQD